MNIYYAHPMAYYDTITEAAVMEAIQDRWPGATVFNPNSELFQKKVDWAEGASYPVMDIFAAFIRDKADIVVYQSFEDGYIGAGVAREMLEARIWGKQLYRADHVDAEVHIQPAHNFSNVLSAEATRERSGA